MKAPPIAPISYAMLTAMLPGFTLFTHILKRINT